MEIKNYQKGDEKKIISLFELVFKRPMSLEQWQWRFENNPAGKYMIKLMWDGDVLAGHYAVSPIKMMVVEREILTTLSLTTMTNPDYGEEEFSAILQMLYTISLNRSLALELYGDFRTTIHTTVLLKILTGKMLLLFIPLQQVQKI